jgi:hypothetical protein
MNLQPGGCKHNRAAPSQCLLVSRVKCKRPQKTQVFGFTMCAPLGSYL